MLWFTLRREYCKWKVDCGSRDQSQDDKRNRASTFSFDEKYWEKKLNKENEKYWEEKLNKEDSYGTFLSAISTLMEDAPEVILVVYHIGLGILPDVWG